MIVDLQFYFTQKMTLSLTSLGFNDSKLGSKKADPYLGKLTGNGRKGGKRWRLVPPGS